MRKVLEKCPACGEKALVWRVKTAGPTPGSGPVDALPGPGLGMMQPIDMQSRVKQEDGSFAWTPWISSASRQSQQAESNLVCPKCGESLSIQGRSTR